MMASLSTQFWIEMLFIVILLIVIVLFFIVRKMNQLARLNLESPETDSQSPSDKKVPKILEVLQPLLEESRLTADRFEDQIREKKRLIKELNEALDSRIISINLLLSRAEAQLKKIETQQAAADRTAFLPTGHEKKFPLSDGDQSEQILAMYSRNMDADTIARKLSVPKGEVSLVIELKKKFIAMENGMP